MIRRLVIGTLVFLAIAPAQIRLLVVEGSSETALGAVFDAGTVAAGDTKLIRFRARNSGTAATTITTISAGGSGFRITDRPVLPYTLAPGAGVDFVVEFAPASPGRGFSANIQVNSSSVLIVGAAVAAAAISNAAGSPCAWPAGAKTIDFGSIERKQSRTCSFGLQNPWNTEVTVSEIRAGGEAFSGPQGLSAPLTLKPAETATFQVTFTPPLSRTFAGTLVVDGRNFTLTGAGFDPPLPRTILETEPVAGSAQQRTMRLRLAGPSPIDASGLVRLDFRSLVAGVANDPAIVFAATGSRNVAFQIREGESSARFGSQNEVVFQTGTTAGTIQFLVEMNGGAGGSAAEATGEVVIPRANVQIDSARSSRRVNDVDVEIAGYDNTYTAGPLAFTFFDGAGRTIEPGVIRVDATADFRLHFSRAQAGSAFVLRATFPVSGDVSQVAGVEVEMTNLQGSARTQRLAIQ